MVLGDMRRGLLLQRLGDLEGALKDLNVACKCDPSNLTYRRTRASCLKSRGQLAAALADLEVILDECPFDVVALSQKGYALLRLSC